MATGYTYPIEGGISFYNFVLRCAHAMGACIMQRDDHLDVLPKIQEPSDYHKNEIKRIEKEISNLKTLKDCDIEVIICKANKKELADREETTRNRISVREKYAAMLANVNAWKPPTSEHVGFKDFMISQITESMKYGCDIHSFQPNPIPVINASEYRAEKMEKLLRDLSYRVEENRKELERADERNRWITELYKSMEPYKGQIAPRPIPTAN